MLQQRDTAAIRADFPILQQEHHAGVPLIYLDESRAFGGALDDADYRLRHYREVFHAALARAGMAVGEGCR